MRTTVALIMAAALLAPGVAGSAGEPVTLAYSQLGLLAHLPWQVALGQKYFEEQGLEPKGYNFESGAKSIAALIGGSADFAANALEHAIKAKVQGKDLVYVFSSTRLPGFGLAVASNLARGVIDGLRKDGVVHRAYLGLQARDLEPEVAARLGVPKDAGGVVVAQIRTIGTDLLLASGLPRPVVEKAVRRAVGRVPSR